MHCVVAFRFNKESFNAFQMRTLRRIYCKRLQTGAGYTTPGSLCIVFIFIFKLIRGNVFNEEKFASLDGLLGCRSIMHLFMQQSSLQAPLISSATNAALQLHCELQCIVRRLSNRRPHCTESFHYTCVSV